MQRTQLFDAGLQLERTHLGWSRTAAALTVNALLAVRGVRHAHPAALAMGIAGGLAALAAVAWWHGRSAYARRSAALGAGRSPVDARLMWWFSRATTVLLIAALAVTAASLLDGESAG